MTTAQILSLCRLLRMSLFNRAIQSQAEIAGKRVLVLIHNRGYVTLALIWAILMLVAAGCGSGSGGRIFFTSDRDGNLELYSVDLNGERQINLTKTPEDETSPVLSSDGRKIAYLVGTETSSAIEVIRANDESKTRLTGNTPPRRSQRWSPESDRIAFIKDGDEGPELLVINVDGSEELLLTFIPGDEISDWSQDGNLIAFSVHSGEAQGIYVRNPDGVNEIRLTETPDYNPVFSPDSKRIAFLSTRDGNPEIYVMDVDGSDQTRITATDADEYNVSWSRNGKRLLFVSERDGNPEIYVTDIKGEDQTRLTQNAIRDDQPTWSPDSKRIAFVSYLDGDGEIIVMDADGKNQTRLTNNDAQDTNPLW